MKGDRQSTTRTYTTSRVSDPSNIPYKFITYERIEEDKQDFGQHSKQKKKEYYRKVLIQLIEDLEGRTYLEKSKDSKIWEGV